jgi:uncharacterized membrane protein
MRDGKPHIGQRRVGEMPPRAEQCLGQQRKSLGGQRGEQPAPIGEVPPRLPAPGLLVTVTGVLELLGAACLLLPATRVAAAVCLLVLMLAMFPANVYAARMPNPPTSMTTRLSARTATEIVFLAAAVTVAVGSG